MLLTRHGEQDFDHNENDEAQSDTGWGPAYFDREVGIVASVDHLTLLAFRGFVPIENEAVHPPAIVMKLMKWGSIEDYCGWKHAELPHGLGRCEMVHRFLGRHNRNEDHARQPDFTPGRQVRKCPFERAPRIVSHKLPTREICGFEHDNAADDTGGDSRVGGAAMYEDASYWFRVGIDTSSVLLYISLIGQDFFP